MAVTYLQLDLHLAEVVIPAVIMECFSYFDFMALKQNASTPFHSECTNVTVYPNTSPNLLT